MAKKTTTKKIAFIMAMITLLSFIYKVVLAILTPTLVLYIAAVSTLMIFICKILYAKYLTKTRDKKKKAYFGMTVALFIYSLIFILFSILKINNIDISSDKTYEGLIGSILICFMLLMFILSILGLRKALDKTDIMFIGIKEMTFASALMDLIIIEEYVSRIILQYVKVTWMSVFNGYFALGVGAILIFISIRMFIRFFSYKA